ATDAAGNVGAYSTTATATTNSAVATSGSLSGSWAASSGTVDLTSTGTSDWVQWPGTARKANGGAQISNLSAVGGTSSSYIGDIRTMKWSDGMPSSTGSTTTGVQMSGNGKGFQVTAPADTTPRTLTVYIGAQNGSGKLTAHLSDGSAADYANALTAGKQRSDGVYTL